MTAIMHRYRPRGACMDLFTGPHSRDRELLLSGPAGTGKSRGCLEKMHACALKYEGMRGLIVRQTAVSLTSTGLVTFREKVAPEALQAGVCRFYGGSRAEASAYKYANGSSLSFAGMDNPTKVMSSEYDMIYVQEAIELTLTGWESLASRKRNGVMPYQQMIADTNPGSDLHWLNQRCQAGLTHMLHSRHQDNPVYVNPDGTYTPKGEEYILGVLEKLTGVRRARLYEGKWVSAEGLVYEGYDPAVHVVDSYDVPASWPRMWVIDFGYSNPTCVQFWARDPDANWVMYREIYHTRQTVEEHAATIAHLVMDKPTVGGDGAWRGPWREPRPIKVICDPASADGRAVIQAKLALSTVAADKAMDTGIVTAQAWLAARPEAGRRPRLTFMRDALVERDAMLADRLLPTRTVEEFPDYIWDIGNGLRRGERPVKKNDHGMDCVRYLVADAEKSGPVRVRFFNV